MADKLIIEILEDGQIKVTTEGISQVNHCNADELISLIGELAGGERNTQRTKPGHMHLIQGKRVYHNH